MPERQSPFESLEEFDRLDLDIMVQRRLAAYALRDFYGAAMNDIGQEYLDFPPDFRKRGLKSQWGKITSRLDWMGEVTVPDELDSLPPTVNEISNKVDHDFDENPPTSALQHARDKADEWYDWLLEEAQTYQENVANMNSRDMMIRMSKERIQDAKQDPSKRIGEIQSAQEKLNEDADSLQDRLKEVEEKTERVPTELVRVFSEAIELEQWCDSINEVEGDLAYDRAMEQKYDEYKDRGFFS